MARQISRLAENEGQGNRMNLIAIDFLSQKPSSGSCSFAQGQAVPNGASP
jgi:hypothetical protein